MELKIKNEYSDEEIREHNKSLDDQLCKAEAEIRALKLKQADTEKDFEIYSLKKELAREKEEIKKLNALLKVPPSAVVATNEKTKRKKSVRNKLLGL